MKSNENKGKPNKMKSNENNIAKTSQVENYEINKLSQVGNNEINLEPLTTTNTE